MPDIDWSQLYRDPPPIVRTIRHDGYDSALRKAQDNKRHFVAFIGMPRRDLPLCDVFQCDKFPGVDTPTIIVGRFIDGKHKIVSVDASATIEQIVQIYLPARIRESDEPMRLSPEITAPRPVVLMSAQLTPQQCGT